MMNTLLSIWMVAGSSPAIAAPYVLDFEVTGVASGSPEWDLHQDLLDQLNVGVVDVDLSQSVGDPALTWEQNGTSQLAFTNDPAVVANFPALAYRWNLGNGDWECDMGVDTDTAYTPSNAKVDSSRYGGSERTLGTTMMHELGHCMRLGHVSTEYNIMGSDTTHVSANGGVLYFYQGEDAADRLVDLHDVNTNFEDIGIVHWRYAGNPGGDAYSDHERTVVMTSDFQELDSYTEDSGDTPVFLVRQGQTVRPEFSFENNGSTNTVSVDLDYLLSSNDFITSFDEVLYSTNITIGRDNVYTTSRSVTIPSDATPGRQTLGVRATDLINLTDDAPPNNATYIDIEVLANGDADYCVGPEPCERFEGDCDAGSDCVDGLQCVWNVGELFGFSAATDVCDLPQGDYSYCSDDEPCVRHRGDCDGDDQCQGSLQCIDNIGADFGWDAIVDVCDYPLGDPSYCSPTFPCSLGEGDCDSDSDCAAGTCQHNVGAAYGFASNVDVCDFGFGS